MNNATKNGTNSEGKTVKSAMPLFQVANTGSEKEKEQLQPIVPGTKDLNFSAGAASAPLFMTAANTAEPPLASTDASLGEKKAKLPAEAKKTTASVPLFQSAAQSPVYAAYMQKREENYRNRVAADAFGNRREGTFKSEEKTNRFRAEASAAHAENASSDRLSASARSRGQGKAALDFADTPSQETPLEVEGKGKTAAAKAEAENQTDGKDFLNSYEAYESDSLLEVDGTHRRRRRRARGAEETASSAPEQISQVKGSTRLEAKKLRRLEGRKEGRRRKAITESEFLARRESVKRKMIIRSQDGLNQIAVLEDNILVEHYVSRRTQTTMVGSIYQGKVQNVLPSMEAAFVDLGKGRNAVLYAGEVNWDAAGLKGRPRRIEQALKPGDTVTVQVTKDPIGHKGARLTSQLTLPGRYLVLVPGGSMTGISRKLPEEERRRLKKIIRRIVPKDFGVIIRTAAEGASEEQISQDVERLQKQWDKLQKKLKSSQSAPYNLYAEPELSLRVVRDIFNEDFEQLIIQGKESYQQVKEYVQEFAPELEERVELWVEKEDIFSANRIDEQLAKGMDRKVWLPSGGYLIIDRTEAMTVIDVNTGKFTGTGGTLEETVTRNNLEAAEEIMRQLRLRDIGGIVVIDFVDMVLESNRELVLRRLVECLGRDRTRHQVTEVTSLGLVQMTRKRVGEGLVEAFSTTCECCDGRGFIVHSAPVEKDGKNSGFSSRETRKSMAKVMAASKSDAPAKADPEDKTEKNAPAGLDLKADLEKAAASANNPSETPEENAEPKQRGKRRGRLVKNSPVETAEVAEPAALNSAADSAAGARETDRPQAQEAKAAATPEEGASGFRKGRTARVDLSAELADVQAEKEAMSEVKKVVAGAKRKNARLKEAAAKSRTGKHQPAVWTPSSSATGSGVVTVTSSSSSIVVAGNKAAAAELDQKTKAAAANTATTAAKGRADKSSAPLRKGNNKHRAVTLPVSAPKSEGNPQSGNGVKLGKAQGEQTQKLSGQPAVDAGQANSASAATAMAEAGEAGKAKTQKGKSEIAAEKNSAPGKAPKRIRIAKKVVEEKPEVKPLNQQEAALSVREALNQANMLLSTPTFSLKAANNAFGVNAAKIDAQVEQAAAEAKKARKNRGKKRGAARS